MTQLTIRAIAAQDKETWLKLWQGYLDFYNVNLTDDVTQDVWQRLMNSDDALCAFVAQDGDQVIGFTHYFFHGTTWKPTSYCYLEDLYVDQTVRSRGAGRALIQAVKDTAIEKGAAKLYWHTDQKNETAQALYNKIATLTDYIRYDIALD